MKPVIDLLPNLLSIQTEQTALFIEISSSGLSYLLRDHEADNFRGVALYHFEHKNSPDEIAAEVERAFLDHSLVNNQFAEITVVYDFPESVLVPESIFEEGRQEEYLGQVFGELYPSTYFHEKIKGHPITNVYRVPDIILEAVKNEFKDHRQVHRFSLLAADLDPGKDLIRAIFQPGLMTVVASKKGSIQLIREYGFSKAEDVIWQLLTIAESYSMENVVIRVGGMIDHQSTLYLEIRKYFSRIEMNHIEFSATFEEEMKELPPHYFTHLYHCALCV